MRRAISHLSGRDPVIGRIIAAVGPYKITYLEPTFPTLVRSIVYQQLSGKVAKVIFGRLEEAAGGITPRSILALEQSRLRGCGLSGRKTAYIRDLADKTVSGAVSFRKLPAMPDEGVIEHLTGVKGIGVWTAQMFLIFALRRPDVLPGGDLGIRTAIRNVYELADLPSPKEVDRIGAPWRPYATVASWYLWRSLDNEAAL